MKKEIVNCLTWYANKVAETTSYKSWSDEFCRKEINESTERFLGELKKHIDWENLTEEECRELRFGKWASDSDIDEEIEETKKRFEENKEEMAEKCLSLEEEIANLERTKGVFLIPLYLLPIVPVGTELTSISGCVVKYDGQNIDNDIRFGCIAYGIKLKESEVSQ